jgi:hypothetical protein
VAASRHDATHINEEPAHHFPGRDWLKAKPQQPHTVAELQTLCDTFLAYYNSRRPHRSLNRQTPMAAYQARPKATPTGSTPEPQPRVRRDIID